MREPRNDSDKEDAGLASLDGRLRSYRSLYGSPALSRRDREELKSLITNTEDAIGKAEQAFGEAKRAIGNLKRFFRRHTQEF